LADEMDSLKSMADSIKELRKPQLLQDIPRYAEISAELAAAKVNQNTLTARVISRMAGYGLSRQLLKTVGGVPGTRGGGGLYEGAAVELGQSARRAVNDALTKRYRGELERAAAALSNAPIEKGEVIVGALGGVTGKVVSSAQKAAALVGPHKERIQNILLFTQADLDRQADELAGQDPGDKELALRAAASNTPVGSVGPSIPFEVNRHRFLRDKLPRRLLTVQDSGELQIPNSLAQKMSATERASFKRYVMAAYNPQLIMNEIADLRVSRETKEAVQALYPEYWNAARAMARQVIVKMIGRGEAPSRAQRATLETLLDRGDNGVSDALFYQRLYSPPERQMPPRRMKGTSSGITDQRRTELESLASGGSR
jgi:hypothetical protein